MIKQIEIYFLTLLFLIVVDSIWISKVMGSFYTAQLKPIALMKGASLSPRILYAVLTWFLVALGLVLFVLPKLTPLSPFWQPMMWGALFGFVAYGIYDLTNYATIAKWTLTMTIVDMAWGMTVCAITSLVMHNISKLIMR
jgi:uncharacterized membrane protein